jgi:hypothetical protein
MIRAIFAVGVGGLIGYGVIHAAIRPPHHLNLDHLASRYGTPSQHDPEDDDMIVTSDRRDDEPVPVWRPKDHNKARASDGPDPLAKSDELNHTLPAPVPPKIVEPPSRHVIASSMIIGARCYVQGQANGAPFTFSVDTGSPVAAIFSASYIKKLGLDAATLHYEEIWPGTRYGKIATTTLHEIRVGDVTWSNVQVRVYGNWRFAFGDDETPLLGLDALQRRGIHLEFDGDMCRLTAPPVVGARQ